MTRILPLALAAALPAGLALAAVTFPQPLLLFNPSPSVATGLYVRASTSPAVGRLLAFRTPRGGRAYAHAHLPELDRGSILKPIVGGPGSTACVVGGDLRLDGRMLGPIADRDTRGAVLPHWSGCRRLGAGEYLVFSNRIWNSFDSRYYGPVTACDILGVYRLAWAIPSR